MVWWARLIILGQLVTVPAVLADDNEVESRNETAFGHLQHANPGLSVSMTRSAAARKAKCRDQADRYPLGKNRMKDQSLSHKVAILSSNENADDSAKNAFERILEMEEENQQSLALSTSSSSSSSPTRHVSPWFWRIAGSATFMTLSAQLLAQPNEPSSLATVSWTTLGNSPLSLVWLPWIWSRPYQFAIFDAALLFQFVRQPTIWPYFQKQIFPLMWKSLHGMILAEISARIWKWVFAELRQIQVYEELLLNRGNNSLLLTMRNQTMESVASLCGQLPQALVDSLGRWMEQIHSLLVGSVEKGIQRSIKRGVKNTIVSSLTIWRNVIQEQMLLRL